MKTKAISYPLLEYMPCDMCLAGHGSLCLFVVIGIADMLSDGFKLLALIFTEED